MREYRYFIVLPRPNFISNKKHIMSNVLLLSIPSHGHMNPLMGLTTELVKQGEKVTFFSSDEFRKPIEESGAEFKCYKEDINIFKPDPQNKDNQSKDNFHKDNSDKNNTDNLSRHSFHNDHQDSNNDNPDKNSPDDQEPQKSLPGFFGAILNPDKFISDVLMQIKDQKFDYIIFSAAYPYASLIARILNIPAVSSFAVFITREEILAKKTGSSDSSSSNIKNPFMDPLLIDKFNVIRQSLQAKYNVEVTSDMFSLLYNKGDLNIIYTSKYFVAKPENYDESYVFVGPPVYQKKYNVEFPFEKIKGKKVIYISMGTVFSNHSAELNQVFFRSFANKDVVVVMAAYDVDTTTYDIPDNFIVRNYVPQLDILKYTSVAITHAGMNSIGDLISNNVPFVAIPMGSDQFYLANRAEELGATIVTDFKTLTPEILNDAVEKVLTDPEYLQNIKKINQSFTEAGGFERAAEEIFKLKKDKGISS